MYFSGNIKAGRFLSPDELYTWKIVSAMPGSRLEQTSRLHINIIANLKRNDCSLLISFIVPSRTSVKGNLNFELNLPVNLIVYLLFVGLWTGIPSSFPCYLWIAVFGYWYELWNINTAQKMKFSIKDFFSKLCSIISAV